MRKNSHRSGVITLVAIVGLAGCGSGGRAHGALGDAAIISADVVARADVFHQPLDAAPTPNGMTIYFVATGLAGPAVYSVPGTGGSPSLVAAGGPLARPTGVAVATDNSRIFLADQQAQQPGTTPSPATGAAGATGATGATGSTGTTGTTVATGAPGTTGAAGAAGAAGATGTTGATAGSAASTAGGGAILTVPVSGPTSTPGVAQAPTIVPGTQGRSPRGLDVVNQGDSDVIYFTGTDPANGLPGLFEVPSVGGTVLTIAEGVPFIHPDSVVVSAQGVAYVSDQGPGPVQGMVLRVTGGAVIPVLAALDLGSPAGVTLIHNDLTLLVSSLDPLTNADQVLFFDIPTGKTAVASKVIGANKASSGGLHRAHAANVLAWADVSGQVYRVPFRP